MGWFDEAKEQKSLAHHGVKGQRWGVRRYQNYDGTRKAAAKSNSKKSSHDFKDTSASKSNRGDMVKAMLGSYGLTAVSALGNAALLGAGHISPGLMLLSVSSIATSVGTTAGLIAGDVANAQANKKEKQFAEERAQNPIDKKTGFHKKTTDMTPDEDMERVNPGYTNWDQNTKNNCTLCTMAFELRRRGYDVQANKATEGYDAEALVKDWFTGSKPKSVDGSISDSEVYDNYINGKRMDRAQKTKMINNTIESIEKQPNGSRGMLSVTWDGVTFGHAMSYANEDGKLVIYDTQANQKYTGNEARQYLDKTSQIYVTRLDNCQINTKYIKEVAT